MGEVGPSRWERGGGQASASALPDAFAGENRRSTVQSGLVQIKKRANARATPRRDVASPLEKKGRAHTAGALIPLL